MITNCPTCSASLRVPEQLVGRTVKCPHCAVHFVCNHPGSEQGFRTEDTSDSTTGSRHRLALGLAAILFLLSLCFIVGGAVIVSHSYDEYNRKEEERQTKERKLLERESRTQEKEKALTRKESRIEEVIEEGLHRRGARLEVREQAIVGKENALTKKEESLDKKEAVLSQREAAINKTVEEAVAARVSSLAKKEGALAKKESEIQSTIREAVAEKSAALDRKKRELDELLERAARGEEALTKERQRVATEKTIMLDKQAAPLLKLAVGLLNKGFGIAARQKFGHGSKKAYFR